MNPRVNRQMALMLLSCALSETVTLQARSIDPNDAAPCRGYTGADNRAVPGHFETFSELQCKLESRRLWSVKIQCYRSFQVRF
jgi:hypothetical protein